MRTRKFSQKGLYATEHHRVGSFQCEYAIVARRLKSAHHLLSCNHAYVAKSYAYLAIKYAYIAINYRKSLNTDS